MLNEHAEQLMRHIPQVEHERVMQALCLLVDGLRCAIDYLPLSADGTRPPRCRNVRRTEKQRVPPAANAAVRLVPAHAAIQGEE